LSLDTEGNQKNHEEGIFGLLRYKYVCAFVVIIVKSATSVAAVEGSIGNLTISGVVSFLAMDSCLT